MFIRKNDYLFYSIAKVMVVMQLNCCIIMVRPFNGDTPKGQLYSINCGDNQSDARIEKKDEVIIVSITIDGEIQNLELKSE